MKLLIDDADVNAIRRLIDYYPIDGVTTNPTILARSGRSPFDVLGEIRSIIGPEAELHAQVTARDAAGMIEDGRRIAGELGPNTFAKVPSVPEGFKAMKALVSEGVKVTATAVYTPLQAYLAGKAGASYAAPYINRIDNMGYDGVAVACAIHDIFRANGIACNVLAASFKNSQQVLELAQYGVGAATVASSVIDGLVKNPAIDAAVDAFISDFEGLVGAGKTMASC
ncbi:transaldolase family protein [Bifidobacterium callimiconis]|uniref:Transaldolase n=1 Tax=Bifidobacterium callimiconis TaxID=2306973 RepID=A0A430FCG7_9BIFI|nr:transaldolase family protein [Bifidobacterium callimiconis]MBT1177448.1 fructose-6-phosphate aldolase [Bifidobacterium callimiconis]RSX50501.1 transaldolase [Bifidobacterium callimiconis]